MSGMAFLIEKFSLHQKSVPIWTSLSGPGSTLGTPQSETAPISVWRPLNITLILTLYHHSCVVATLAMAGSTQAWLWRGRGIFRGWLKGENFNFGFGKAPPKDQSVYWRLFMGFVFVSPNPKTLRLGGSYPSFWSLSCSKPWFPYLTGHQNHLGSSLQVMFYYWPH